MPLSPSQSSFFHFCQPSPLSLSHPRPRPLTPLSVSLLREIAQSLTLSPSWPPALSSSLDTLSCRPFSPLHVVSIDRCAPLPLTHSRYSYRTPISLSPIKRHSRAPPPPWFRIFYHALRFSPKNLIRTILHSNSRV
jgi:hypothetical protein